MYATTINTLTEKITALTAQHKANGLKQIEDIKHIITPMVKCRSPGLEGIAGDSGRGWRTLMITLYNRSETQVYNT